MVDFLIYLLTMIGIWGLLSLSLNLQFGFTGLVNLGHIAFFMLGAYISVIVVMLLGLPMVAGVAAGMAAAAAFGALIALPTAGLQQDYWAISTLAAAEIVRLVFLNTTLGNPYTGGAFGVTGIPQPFIDRLGNEGFALFYLGLVLATLVVVALFLWWLSRTPFGRVLVAVRENDSVALALGKDVRSFRLRAMAIGGAVGGLAGALFAHFNAYIAPTYFMPLETFLVWAMVILGGTGNWLGALLGTVVIQALYQSTRFLDDFLPFGQKVMGDLRMIVIGVLILLIILYLPKGVVPERMRRYGATRPARPEEAAAGLHPDNKQGQGS